MIQIDTCNLSIFKIIIFKDTDKILEELESVISN